MYFPDCDILLINLDTPWNQKTSRNLLNYNTDDVNLDAVNFILRELKKIKIIINIIFF